MTATITRARTHDKGEFSLYVRFKSWYERNTRMFFECTWNDGMLSVRFMVLNISIIVILILHCMRCRVVVVFVVVVYKCTSTIIIVITIRKERNKKYHTTHGLMTVNVLVFLIFDYLLFTVSSSSPLSLLLTLFSFFFPRILLMHLTRARTFLARFLLLSIWPWCLHAKTCRIDRLRLDNTK